MITIFRRIREKLIASGSVTKYLLYAVGEIALVMIGILLALQVNNWNEDRKLQQQEQYLLSELKKEFEQNLRALKSDYEKNYNGMETSYIFLKLLADHTSATVDPTQIDSLAHGLIYNYAEFDVTSGIIDDIINSGKLEVIRSDSLRYVLSQWSGQLTDLDQDYVFRNKYFIERVMPELEKYIPMVNALVIKDDADPAKAPFKLNISGKDHDLKLMTDPTFESVIAMHAVNMDYVLLNLDILKDYVNNALRLIDEEQKRFE